ncbi:eukaryotic translation initiation factor 3 subunit A [Polychaeton citri CBS 116435]|uniref:Eukaryotic translation initiation factor 3 subunit A n=1 Tax=Polychaeton citri CBS 116435 TaxID=1314669 RepID=A0A9P4QBN3_9PEZI|nr:eukaryotic translation initiation factor 3 subunit A [Polychaeton citri CBS 116435]
MPPPPHTKPENVLKRAQELIGVGQQQAALSILHEHVTSKRTRNSTIAVLEPVMLLFVELCVDLKKGKMAKDGLYNYKNTSQNTNVATIELVFKKFIELAEQKVTEAQQKADEISGTADQSLANVTDLENIETPESILLSTVSGEQSKDRTDRAIVTPWLKFLWETYRTVLDIFKNNARLEVMYQNTAHQAFEFCQKYTRKTEFRRLCELLRNHLQNAAKYSQQVHAINLSEPDTLQRHLDTRFKQLNVADELELWQEAFKSVEDIHTLLNLSKRQPKNVMMANYFEKLTRIFLVSENYLFHAAAWSRYYNLLLMSARQVAGGAPKKDSPSNITDADLTKAASYVLLSALSIPVISTSRSRGALIDVDATRSNKNARLTNLLGMNSPPSRAILFKDALSKDILQRAKPEIRNLYNILEADFHPKSICAKVSPILAQIAEDEDMKKYGWPLQQVILTRLFQQLSQVYTDVKLQDVLTLAQFPDPFQVSAANIEKFIMNGCKKGDLSIRIDHATGVLTFDSDVFSSAKSLHPGSGSGSAEAETGSVQTLQMTPAEIVRSQLTRLAKSLYTAVHYVDAGYNADLYKQKVAALERAKAGAEQEHAEILARREVIQKKKDTAANQQAAIQREQEQKRRMKMQELQAAETERLMKEAKDRDEKRLEMERIRVKRAEAEKQLNELKHGVKGVDISTLNIDELDSGRIRAIKLQALEREKTEMSEKIRVTAKRLDHLERAYRKEEIKHLPEDKEKQRDDDLKAYEKSKKETLQTAEQKHKEDVTLKHRLSRLVGPYEAFRKDITAQRQAEFEKRRRSAEKELQQKMDQRRQEVRQQRAAEKRRIEEEERLAREEEERRAIEEEQAEREAEEKRQKDAEAKEQAEQRRLERMEAARRQMEREEEAERRRKEKKTGAPSFEGLRRGPPPTAAAAEEGGSEVRTAPKLNLSGRSGAPVGSWRERGAARAAAGASGEAPSLAPAPATPSATSPAAEEPPRRGGYIPPALRGKAPGADSTDRTGSRGREGGSYRPPGARDGARDGAREEKGRDSPASTGGAYKPPGARSSGAYMPPGARRG